MSDEPLVVDGLEYRVRRSPRRTTLGITIDRDGSLTITVPADCPRPAIETFEREKRLWVFTKLAERDLLFRRKRQREYVSGESFYYLGRAHRLRLVNAGGEDVPLLRLLNGRFELRRDAVADADEHFQAWYVEHGQPWIEERVKLYAGRVGVKPTATRVRPLGHRWGSCSTTGTLNFHWQVAGLPPRIIDYIIVHELVHLLVPHHTAEFWTRVERVLPDYEARKRWLAERGGEYC